MKILFYQGRWKPLKKKNAFKKKKQASHSWVGSMSKMYLQGRRKKQSKRSQRRSSLSETILQVRCAFRDRVASYVGCCFLESVMGGRPEI